METAGFGREPMPTCTSHSPVTRTSLSSPEQSLLFCAQGMQVALVQAQDRVHLQDVVLGHNLGTNVQVIAGLQPTDKLIADPSSVCSKASRSCP